MGTRGPQTALFVVYESPFMVAADHPRAYDIIRRNWPLLKAVPATWDRDACSGRPTRTATTIARRRGAEWFIDRSFTGWRPRISPSAGAFSAKGIS